MRKLPIRWGISLPNRGALFGLTDVDELIETASARGTVRCVRIGLVRRQFDSQAALEAITMLRRWRPIPRKFVSARSAWLRSRCAIRSCWRFSGRPSIRFPKAERCSASASAARMKASSGLSA